MPSTPAAQCAVAVVSLYLALAVTDLLLIPDRRDGMGFFFFFNFIFLNMSLTKAQAVKCI